MINNPIHKRLEKLAVWQHVTFMLCLCERMYPNFALFCKETEFAQPNAYRKIVDVIWEHLLVKNAKIDFELQLEKLEELIPEPENYDIYAVYPAIDAGVALSDLLHSLLSGDSLSYAIAVSKTSLNTVAMLEMSYQENELSEPELKELPAIQDELDIQWEIYRLLNQCEEYDIELIKGLRKDIREANMSNIGIVLC